jgi:galactarate dehydratase
MNQSPLYIRVHPDDNVAIVVNDGGLGEGAAFADGLVLRERVPQGHKVALKDLEEGEAVIRYNVVIGYANKPLSKGSWVNEHVLRMPTPPELHDLPIATIKAPDESPLDGFTFEGYRNADGSVGTRNILAITTTVQCVADVVQHAVTRIKAELLPNFPNVDDVVSLGHTYGCGVAIDAPDAMVPIRTVRNIALNPNFGGEVMMVSLGCEKLQPERLMPAGTIPIAAAAAQTEDVADIGDLASDENGGTVVLQDESHVGFGSMIESIMRMAQTHLKRLNNRRRETCPAADLVIGVQCGGSDAFSGLTANPAVGFATDLLVRAGATVMFSEVTEVRDGVAQLTARAANGEVAAAIIREMQWYDDYLKRGGADRSANTTPGNKKGGLSNIVEKAMGSIVKSGSSTISGVLSPGEKVKQKGLIYAATPASDFICGTLQLASGINLHVFTTGRGTPYSLAEVPVIKVATRSDLARRWHDLMDVNAGTIATGEATIADVGWELFRLMLDVASGKKQTKAEALKLHNALVLFNPAPVT